MYQRDYILRMIEQAAKMIAALLGLIKKGDLEKATKELEHMYYSLLKQDAAFFNNIPESKLTDSLLHKHNYTNGHLEILAGLFNADALLQLAYGKNDKALSLSKKSLLLFDFIDREERTWSAERLELMNKIRDRIVNLETNSHEPGKIY